MICDVGRNYIVVPFKMYYNYMELYFGTSAHIYKYTKKVTYVIQCNTTFNSIIHNIGVINSAA